MKFKAVTRRRRCLNRVVFSVDAFMSALKKMKFKKSKILTGKKDEKKPFLQVGSAFDIETTTINKKAYMYCWQFQIGKLICFGRTWEEFIELYGKVVGWLKYQNVALICYVANLGFEFQFLRKRIVFDNVFATEQRKPLFIQAQNIEFRDALYLSGQGGLKNLAKNYTKTQKLVGDLAYDVLRNSKTKLSNQELLYTFNDVQILVEFAEVMFEKFPDKIPYTQTGIIRNAIKSKARETKESQQAVVDMIKKCFPKEQRTYKLWMDWLFRGGLTHGNVYFAKETVENVWGVDFVSSYPGVMLTEKYPYQFKSVYLESDNTGITDTSYDPENMAYMFICEFTNIRRRTLHSLESKHKIIEYSDDAKFDNGRLMQASRIKVFLTELDYESYKRMYQWDGFKLDRWYTFASPKDYLPAYLLEPLMDAYIAKNDLKKRGLDGTFEYVNAKAKVNSSYGCCVQRMNDVMWTVDVDGEWFEDTTGGDYKKERYKQVLLPQWGIWITAYARAKLVKAITDIDCDIFHNYVLYYDTDSIYMLDCEYTRQKIKEFNEPYFEKNKQLNDVFWNIGTFEPISDETCTFKTLGAKRYVKWYGDHLDVTVAGLPFGAYERKIGTKTKQTEDSIEVVINKDTKEKRWVSKEKFFHDFETDLLLTTEVSGKKTSCYNDEAHSDYVTDEQGNTERMEELSSVAIYPIPFKITMLELYLQVIEECRHASRERIFNENYYESKF